VPTGCFIGAGGTAGDRGENQRLKTFSWESEKICGQHYSDHGRDAQKGLGEKKK
jgi:hypothetical protein